MKTNFLTTIIFICFTHFIAASQNVDNKPIILLSSKALKDIKINGDFRKSFDITRNGDILLSSNNQFYLLGWENFEAIEPKFDKPINSFAFTSENDLMIVSDSKLYFLDRFSQLVEYYKLPNKNMGLVTGASTIYVFDKVVNKQNKYGIYMLHDEQYSILLEFPYPVLSVAEYGKKILFSSRNQIFSVDLETKEMEKFIELPDNKDNIISLSYNPFDNLLYFSTDTSVYCQKDDKMWCMIQEFGGLVRYCYQQLFVFQPENQFLIMFNLAENQQLKVEKPKTPPAEPPVIPKQTQPISFPTE
jgi:hypothetical protein